ncbi:hypothetical protein [Porphyrobacter sp. YT40]|uniref:hypothetical protein n=1 Tax=Porphyrobacter sp. YT40 TaxID=2547601 RepID=UPI0015E8B1FB|nr:hypothetical protein [Porphyrobacter sp. YT40]
MSSTLSIWHAAPGALAVTIKPLRPFIPKPRLSLISPEEERDFAFQPDDTGLTAVIPEAAVEQLMRAGGTPGGAHLVLGVRALFEPGAPTRRWQWGIRLAQDGAALTGYGSNRISMPADAEGFVRSAVRAFPHKRTYGFEEWELSLQDAAQNPAAPGASWQTSQPLAACAGR